MELHWIDAALKRWARWLNLQVDKSMGWPKFSCLVNLGMPKSPSASYPAVQAGIHEECEQINEIVRKRLEAQDAEKVFAYYVEYHCKYRPVARRLGITDKTVRVHIQAIQAKIARHLDDIQREAVIAQEMPIKKRRGRPPKQKVEQVQNAV